MDTGSSSLAHEFLALSAASQTPCARRKALRLAHAQGGEEQGQVFVEWKKEERLEALSS